MADDLVAQLVALLVDGDHRAALLPVRGADLLDSTPRQLLLYRLLDLPAPSFFHFPLLLSADGRRLSKRNADAGLDVLQDRCTPEEVLGKLAYLAGFNPSASPKSARALLADFRWDKVPRADIRIPEGLF